MFYISEMTNTDHMWHQRTGCIKHRKLKKIQVVRIPNEQQWILLREAKQNCTYKQLTKWTNTSHKGLMCDSTFDDVMCWPPTAAGTTAAQYCPSYISNFNVTGNFQR